MSLTDYVQAYAKRPSLATVPVDDRADQSMAVAFDLSFRQFRDEAAEAAQLLYLCSFLAPESIPIQMIRHRGHRLPEPLRSATKTASTFSDKAVAPLIKYALARREGQVLHVHFMTQKLVRERLSDDQCRKWSEAAAVLLNDALPPFKEGTYQEDVAAEYERLLPHAMTAAEHAERFDSTSPGALAIRRKEKAYATLRGRLPRDEYEAAFSEIRLLVEQILLSYEQAATQPADLVAEAVNRSANLQTEWAKNVENVAWSALRNYAHRMRVSLPYQLSQQTNYEEMIDLVRHLYSPVAHFKDMSEIVHKIWDESNKKHRNDIESIWMSAREYFVSILEASTMSTSALYKLQRTVAPRSTESFSPDLYVAAMDRLANAMWFRAGSPRDLEAIHIWLAAEKHIRAIATATIRTARKGSDLGHAVAGVLKQFSPEAHLERIQTAAFYMSENAEQEAGRSLDYWVEAEERILQEIKAGSLRPSLSSPES